MITYIYKIYNNRSSSELFRERRLELNITLSELSWFWLVDESKVVVVANDGILVITQTIDATRSLIISALEGNELFP